VQFTGYENWRAFKTKNNNGHAPEQPVEPAKPAAAEVTPAPAPNPKKYNGLVKKAGIAIAIIALPCILFFIPANSDKITAADYSFSSKKVVTQGLPNSVVFDYNASKSPYDSVIIQQSWDKNLQVKVPRDGRQQTCMYYYPEYYHAKLIVGNQVVQHHDFLIKTDGWLPIIEQSPVPVYLDKKKAVKNGVLSITANEITLHNINMQPEPPKVLMANVQDFGEIYTDDFTLETSVRNDYREGSAVCQLSHIYILCKESGIWIPLSAKGCISSMDVLFTNYYRSGKQQDLSGFGVDFSKFVKVRIESKNGKANIFINDKPAYTVTGQILKTKIVGVDFEFEGAGSVDYVRLSNSKLHYDEEF
jgi:hypothetical protein